MMPVQPLKRTAKTLAKVIMAPVDPTKKSWVLSTDHKPDLKDQNDTLY
jgi:hypothetical protein